MILSQILTEIKTLVPVTSDITDDQLVLKINQVQRKIYRQLPLPDKVVAFQSTPSIPFYDLPTDCSEDGIKNALVDNIDYKKLSNQEETITYAFCTVFINKLYLNPNPSNAVNVFLYYRPRYHDLISTNLNDTPDLPEDYHELLVFGCAQWVASTQRDVDMNNNMQAEYDSLFEDAKRYFRQMTAKRTRIKDVW
jgi:hypothetical protein